MRKELPPDEEWARQAITNELELPVIGHDDGSRSSMYDLMIVGSNGEFAAVEVTSAADQLMTQAWNEFNGRDARWIEPSLAGSWMVHVLPTARRRVLRTELPALLTLLETQRISSLSARRPRTVPERRAAHLGLRRLTQSATDFPGSIYFHLDQSIDRMAGFVSSTGDPLADWVGEFLASDRCGDVRRKLMLSGALERHAFLIVPGLTVASFQVQDLLIREGAPLPTSAPSLPPEVTHVWVGSVWDSGDGMRWSPDRGWQRFDKRFSVTAS